MISPAGLLESKGVVPNDAAELWVRQVGLLIFVLGVMSSLMRGHPDSPTLNAFLLGNAVLQACLFPIELVAWSNGLITRASGVIPNSVLHLALAVGFVWFFVKGQSAARA